MVLPTRAPCHLTFEGEPVHCPGRSYCKDTLNCPLAIGLWRSPERFACALNMLIGSLPLGVPLPGKPKPRAAPIQWKRMARAMRDALHV